MLVVNPQLPVNNLPELVALVKARAGSLQLCQLGHRLQWSSHHGVAEDQDRDADQPYSLQEYANAADRGQQPAWCRSAGPIRCRRCRSLPRPSCGQSRSMASARPPQLKDLPTMGEQGYPFPAARLAGHFRATGTSPAIFDRYIVRPMPSQATPELKAVLVNLNVEPTADLVERTLPRADRQRSGGLEADRAGRQDHAGLNRCTQSKQ